MERNSYAWEAIKNQRVYSLTGEDVIAVLEEREELDSMSDEEIAEMINYVAMKLSDVLPWSEYVDDLIENKRNKYRRRKNEL